MSLYTPKPEKIYDLVPEHIIDGDDQLLDDYIVHNMNTAERARFFDYLVHDAVPPSDGARSLNGSLIAKNAVERLRPRLEQIMHQHRMKGIPIQDIDDYMKAAWARTYPFVRSGYEVKSYCDAFAELVPLYDEPDEAIGIYKTEARGSLNRLMSIKAPDVQNETTKMIMDGRGIVPMIDSAVSRRFSDGSINHKESLPTHHSSELDEHWLEYLSEPAKQTINRKELKEPYLKAKAQGDDKAIRAMILEGNDYAKHDFLFQKFASLERLKELESTWETDKVARYHDQYAMEALFHSSMAKMAAYLVPELLSRYNGDGGVLPEDAFDAAAESLSRVLADASVTTFKAFQAIQSEMYWGEVPYYAKGEGLNVDELTDEEKDKVRQIAFSSLGKGFKNRHPESQIITKKHQKVINDLEEAKKENADLQKKIDNLKVNHNKELTASTATAMSQAAKDYTRIAYAACADHIRERADLEGQTINFLDEFPTTEGVSVIVQEERQAMTQRALDAKRSESAFDGAPQNDSENVQLSAQAVVQLGCKNRDRQYETLSEITDNTAMRWIDSMREKCMSQSKQGVSTKDQG